MSGKLLLLAQIFRDGARFKVPLTICMFSARNAVHPLPGLALSQFQTSPT